MKIKTITVFLIFFLICSTTFSAVGQITETTKKELIEEPDQKTSSSGTNCAFFIGGCGTIDWPSSEQNFERVVTNAKEMFDSYGTYTTWMELKPDRNDVRNIIENKIPNNLGDEKQIFVYIGAHGSPTGSILMKYTLLLIPITISSGDLQRWFNNMENKLNKKGISYSHCTIVIESCYAGQHVYWLSKNNRIVITATDYDSSSYGNDAGELYFSDAFFSALSNGNSYGRSWEIADNVIDNMNSIRSQNPQLEDTGNEKSVGTDDPDILPIWDGDENFPNMKDGIVAKNNKPTPKSKAKYCKPKILQYPILKFLLPRLFEPKQLGY